MHPEVQELQAKLKEILYDCAIELRATKAALYLFDPEAKRYELITEYGFRGTIRPWADGRDPLIDRSQRSRNPFYVNGLMAEPRLSDILYQSATDRMLVAPIFLRGQLVGVVDMRDKAGKQPFDQSDLVKGQRIADRVAELFSNKNVFSQRFITLSGTSTPMPEPSPPPAAPPSPAEGKYPPHLSKLIEEARAATERLSPPAPAANLGESEIAQSAVPTALANLDILAAGQRLSGAEVELVGMMARETRLKNALAKVREEYEYVLIDRGSFYSFRFIVDGSGMPYGVVQVLYVDCEVGPAPG